MSSVRAQASPRSTSPSPSGRTFPPRSANREACQASSASTLATVIYDVRPQAVQGLRPPRRIRVRTRPSPVPRRRAASRGDRHSWSEIPASRCLARSANLPIPTSSHTAHHVSSRLRREFSQHPPVVAGLSHRPVLLERQQFDRFLMVHVVLAIVLLVIRNGDWLDGLERVAGAQGSGRQCGRDGAAGHRVGLREGLTSRSLVRQSQAWLIGLGAVRRELLSRSGDCR